ncbi:40S ribosomal protein S2 [Fukomys damarensis]|uniref:40S ribosomal protein S2 n=1 Tax=Fukomys damarensis TaxID=885580 RepID=A0A091DT89_FUKDA|nr:40S ribosomal protein S2 [Fukomys damarensis]
MQSLRWQGGEVEDKEWIPVNKLGGLVKDMNIKSPVEIYLFFLGTSLKHEILKIMLVQKQTHAGQQTRFKAFVTIVDYNSHTDPGIKCYREAATAIQGTIILAELSIVPLWRGY